MDTPDNPMKPTDLRGILNYVPKFLGQTFVISIDGSIIEHENLPNLLLDVAVLKSLQINVVIVHGIGKQLKDLAESRGIAISNADGSGPVDDDTLKLAIRASSRASHEILEGVTKTGQRCAITNSVRATPIGVIKGVDYLHCAKISRIDAEFLNHLIRQNIIPIIQPIGFDRNGHTLRINSDLLAVETAFALGATKTIFLSEEPGIVLDGVLKRQTSVTELQSLLESSAVDTLPPSIKSKAQNALKALQGDISRVHIIDGRLHDGLIREVFSNDGVGSLIYGNEYQQIRQASRDDANLIYHLLHSSIRKEELANRSIQSIEANLDRYFVYEIDGNLIGCVALDRFDEDPQVIELNSLLVHPLYQRKGIGRKLVEFATLKAKEWNARRLLALTTQGVAFFREVCGFQEGSPNDLPPTRKAVYDTNERRSKVFFKNLGDA